MLTLLSTVAICTERVQYKCEGNHGKGGGFRVVFWGGNKCYWAQISQSGNNFAYNISS